MAFELVKKLTSIPVTITGLIASIYRIGISRLPPRFVGRRLLPSRLHCLCVGLASTCSGTTGSGDRRRSSTWIDIH
jgi:hypothetical protein